VGSANARVLSETGMMTNSRILNHRGHEGTRRCTEVNGELRFVRAEYEKGGDESLTLGLFVYLRELCGSRS
jgi:hypothetical protein